MNEYFLNTYKAGTFCIKADFYEINNGFIHFYDDKRNLLASINSKDAANVTHGSSFSWKRIGENND